MSGLNAVLKLDTAKIQLPRALAVVPLLVVASLPQDKYWLSVTFGALFLWLCDPGGTFAYRLPRMAAFALSGAIVTAVGFAVATLAWGWVALVTFLLSLLGGLLVKYGLHRYTAGFMLNIWFLVALAIQVSFQATHTQTSAGAQAIAWLGGSALTLAFVSIVWLARGRRQAAQPFADVIPGDLTPVALTKPVISFAVIRALAVTIAVALAFAFNVPNADWMPVAALVAMRGTLEQSTLVAEQRLAGALIGAVLAALLLLFVDSRTALEAMIVGFLGAAAALRAASYAWYCAAIAAAVLVALDLPNPADLATESRRVLFTLIGVAIAVILMLLADTLTKRRANRDPGPTGHAASTMSP